MKTLFNSIIIIGLFLSFFSCKDEERSSQISFTFDSIFKVFNKNLDAYLQHKVKTGNSKYEVIAVYGQGASDQSETVYFEIKDATERFSNGFVGNMSTNLKYCQAGRCFEEVYDDFFCTIYKFDGEGGYIEARFYGSTIPLISTSETEGTSTESKVKAKLSDGVFYLHRSNDRSDY
jgi:hypothetical protein